MAVTTIEAGAGDRNIAGIIYLVAGVSLFSIQDVIIKFFSADLPLLQVMFMRGFVALVPICWLVWHETGGKAFRTDRPVLQIMRGLTGAVCYTSFYMSLAVLPLAEVMTIFYTNPLFIIALAIPLLGEKIGIRSLLAALVGFIGVLVVIRPEQGDVDPAMLLCLFSAVAYAGQSLLSRILGKTESGSGIAFYSMLTFIGFSGVMGLLLGSGAFNQFDHPSAEFLLRAWIWPSGEQLGLIMVIGVIAGLGFYWLAQAYRVGSSSIVAPFEYASLPFAILWGWVFWGSMPETNVIAGSLLIVGSGLYIIRREVTRGRKIMVRKGIRSRS